MLSTHVFLTQLQPRLPALQVCPPAAQPHRASFESDRHWGSTGSSGRQQGIWCKHCSWTWPPGAAHRRFIIRCDSNTLLANSTTVAEQAPGCVGSALCAILCLYGAAAWCVSGWSDHTDGISSCLVFAGMKVAKMMNSHRTPIGAFANFDMPVAP